MFLRKYTASDCKELAELFYNTVHTVNSKDYMAEQLNAWATGKVDLKHWNQSLQEHYSIVAIENKNLALNVLNGNSLSGTISSEIIVGFGDIDVEAGYLDRLYVHKDYQKRGIATALCDELERAARGTITTHASITARPFFEKRGYKVLKEQQVERHGVLLTNYVMEYHLSAE